ncbi:MAG: nitrilase-related carbon-nitrogen hydrolase [Candidatus Anstonellaceae archaeon]
MGGKTIKLGLIQMGMSARAEENLAKAIAGIASAAKKGAQIVCLPELFTAPYFAQEAKNRNEAAKKFAEEVPGKTTTALAAAAKDNGIALVAGSIYEKDSKSGKLYNTSCVFDSSGKLLGKYRKVHIPHDECFYEKDYFEPGNLGFKAFDTPYCRISPLICYDQWFPEAARSVALSGAEIIFYPTAIATVRGVEQTEGNWQQAWENVMRGHAIANGIIVAAVNRCGNEGKMDFWGGSFVCDAFGKTLARAGSKEEVLIAKVDLEHSRNVREGWRFRYNRRPEEYGKLVGKE